MKALLADIGGTSARLAVLDHNGIGPVKKLKVADYPDIIPALEDFLSADAGEPPSEAWLAVAGPVYAGEADLTNAGWHFRAAQIERACGFHEVHIVNDFEALAWSLANLPEDAYATIGEGSAKRGTPMAVIGPGTGLGMAAYVPGPGRGGVLVGEGGHVTMAAANQYEAEVLARMRARHEHVSAERVISGPGLEELYATLAAIEGFEPAERAAADISAHAKAGDCDASRAALDTFCAMLGTIAGDLALTLGARGGVYIAGGIIPQLLEMFRRSNFRTRFEAKGRLHDYLAAVPTHVITHPEPAMIGLHALALNRRP